MPRLFTLFAATALALAAIAPTAAAQSDDQSVTVATVTSSSKSHLPAWVQTVHDHAAVYQADADDDRISATLASSSFLRVVDGGTSRLQVQAYDDSGNPALTGWVDAEQVEPSAPAIGWLVSSTPTTLWSADDASASALGRLDRFTPLQQVDGPVLSRVLVRVYRPDFSGVVDEGWVDTADTGPALAPHTHVPPPTGASASPTSPSQQAFLDATIQAARRDTVRTHVPASVTVAQAILESNWGRSTLAEDANNYFGMKVMGTLGNDGVVWMPTSEYDDSGALQSTTSAFRAYKSLADSVADHGHLLAYSSHYASAMQATDDPQQFATLVAQDGYSSDPTYADKLINLMDQYNLYQLDQ
ncbi:MAG: glucosaminidase domain-containing protein [Chloroflexi bacterium]|nr:glucosaminidase domain-containing protein [Chloroflexota bacterium]